MGQLNLTTSQVQARLDESYVNKDLYSSNPTLNTNEYITYQGDDFFAVSPPYQCNSTTYPDPNNDTNLKKRVRITSESLTTYTDLVFDSVADMQNGITSGGGSVSLKTGDRILIEEVANGCFEIVSGETPNGSTILDTTTGLQAVLKATDKNVLTVTGESADEAQEQIKLAYEDDSIQILQFERRQYDLDKALFFNSYPSAGNTGNELDRGLVVIATGTIFKLTAPTAGGSVLNFGRGADVGNGDDIERTGNITWFGGTVDGDSMAGENGWSFARAENMTFHNIKAVNCKRDYVGTREGGRGLTVHDRCRDVNIYGYSALNCSDYYHVSHLPDYSSADAGNVAITNITQAAQAVVTAPGHVFQVGGFAAIYAVSGMSEINPSYSSDAFYEVVGVSGNDFTIDLDTTNFTPYTSGGRAVIADMTDGGRSPSANIFGGYAEDCEYSLINIEAANQPRVTRFIQAVNVLGVVAKNCGTVTTRGLINGSNAIRLNADVTVYNESGSSTRSLIRGSFQGSDIKVTADVADIESLIDARPTEENPAGTGIDAGYATHPYGTSSDNNYEIKIKYRNDVQSGIVSYIRADDISGSIDLFYRNHADITFTGLSDGVGAGSNFSNITLHNTNTVKIKDNNLGRTYEGSLTTVRGFKFQANTSDHGGYEHHFENELYSYGDTFARFSFKDGAGSKQGGLQYQFSNDRIYFYLDGFTSNYQMSNVAFFPSFDNQRNVGTSGLRFSDGFFVNTPIGTSDKTQKTDHTEIPIEWVTPLLNIVDNIELWRWIQAKAEKEERGEVARLHAGPYAQEIHSEFESIGVNAFNYGFVGKDKRMEIEEVEINGVVTHREIETDEDIWNVRPVELIWLCLWAIRQRQKSIESKLGLA